MGKSDQEMGTESYVPQGWYNALPLLSMGTLADLRAVLGEEIVPVDDRDMMMVESLDGELDRRARGNSK
jgi:hypothetical protein